MQTGAKMIPFVRIKHFKNGQPYPLAHTHIAHKRDPTPRSAVSKLLLERLSLTLRALT